MNILHGFKFISLKLRYKCINKYALTNGRRRVPKCPSRGTNQPILLSTWQKRKWKKGRLLDFQAFPEKPKFLVFVEQKVDNKFWRGFTLALCQREDLGASVEAFPFAEIPLKKKKAWLSFASIFGSIQYLRLFWSNCSHWKGYLFTINSLIETKKNYFISFWSANAVLLEVQGLLSSNTKTSTKNNTTLVNPMKKKNIRCSCKTIILKIKPLFHAERSFRFVAILFAQFWATLLAARVKS